MPPPLQLFVDDRKGITKMKHDPEQQVSELYGWDWKVDQSIVVAFKKIWPMWEMGIMAIYPGPNLSKRDLQYRTYPYLLRKLTITKLDQVWSVGITYIHMKHG